MHGRIYQTIEEVRDTVRNFVARYNAEWLIEKILCRNPLAGIIKDSKRAPAVIGSL